jgi:glycosyltransferase involved in cell wall biosynthesis
MRVALLSYSARAGDAIGNNVAEKVHFFREHAADLRVFVESDQSLHPEVAPYCRVVRKAEPQGEYWQFLRGADLVSVEFGQYYSLLSLLPLLAGGKPRILLDYHGITPPELWGGHNHEALVQGLEQRGLGWCADATITHSRFTQEELAKVAGLPLRRLPRLAYAVDRTLFSPGPAQSSWRRGLGLENARVMLFVGRFAPNKRPDLLVDALHLLSDLTPAVHAVLIGDVSDLYQGEAERCLGRARELGVLDRLHILGPRSGVQLRDAYRSADVLVSPSQWESFCIPVAEAMACGLPVVAARSTVLPETVASAGLTFAAGDATDLARQVRRVLTSSAKEVIAVNSVPRVAVVASRWGQGFVSGAETCLRGIALALQQAGCRVEIFTTCTRSETGQTCDLPVGTRQEEGLPVHRFALSGPGSGGTSPSQVPVQPICSAALLDSLGERQADFDLMITGPYLAALAVEVASRWPDKTIVLPCFHDEPQARHEAWPALYERVAGLFYHTAEEQSFAERVLGINHPGSSVIGTWIDTRAAGDAALGRRLAGAERYVVYSGRYTAEKGLPQLLGFARRFSEEHPGKNRFVFAGEGNIAVPRESWAVDAGLCSAAQVRDLLAGAAALVQLSPKESLSLATLEAWAQGIPVIARGDCAVLAGHLERSGGGWMIDDYEEFAAALLALDQAGERERRGDLGRRYVQEHYGSAELFRERLLLALGTPAMPLAARMQQRGIERAANFDRGVWRERFSVVVDTLLHADPLELRWDLRLKPRQDRCRATAGAGVILVSLRVVNQGSHAAAALGPGRTELRATVHDHTGQIVGRPAGSVALPALLMPGRAVTASVPVAVPGVPGAYEVRFSACRVDGAGLCTSPSVLPLEVTGGNAAGTRNSCLSILDEVQAVLVEANALQTLPDDYTDVTQGAFAGLKLRLKRKLLGNFKKAYVDVLSRQQSACNRQLMQAVQTLAECCGTLEHALRQLAARVAALEQRSEDGNQRSEVASPLSTDF